jgi:Domain of unknown function (DUF4939)
MNKPSRVGQPHSIRTQPVAKPSAREERLERRNRVRDSQTPIMTITQITAVERPLTGTQERDIRRSAEPEPTVTGSGSGGSKGKQPERPPPDPQDPSGDPDPGDDDDNRSDNTPRPGSPDGPGDPDPEGPDGPDDPDDGPDDDSESDSSDEEVTNQELRRAIVALAKGKKKAKKVPYKPKEPETFNGGSPQQLRTFIFQCRLYFNARHEEFSEESDKVYFAITYLKGPALDYFEPFINEPDPDQDYDFLHSWDAFVQHLANLFGSYSPEDDDEDAITSISFPDDGKATKYFIDFAKYQNRIKWDQRALRKVVKDAIPSRISDELRFSREDTSTFLGLRQAVLRIDNDYWKRKQDDEKKLKIYETLKGRLSKTIAKTESKKSGESSKPSTSSGSGNPNNNNGSKSGGSSKKNKKSKSGKGGNNSSGSSSTTPSIASHLGPDGKLTAAEKQRRMDNKLCLVCAEPGVE